jgi:serine/threonine protein kinase
MHRKNIIHRDLKPDNVLLLDEEDLSVCITDLGMACRLTDTEELKMKCGTPGFVAPEILKGNEVGPKADVFSMGSFLFTLITH